MLIMQALAFALPGIAIGLGIAFLLYYPVSRLMSDMSSTSVRPILTADAIILGMFLPSPPLKSALLLTRLLLL